MDQSDSEMRVIEDNPEMSQLSDKLWSEVKAQIERDVKKKKQKQASKKLVIRDSEKTKPNLDNKPKPKRQSRALSRWKKRTPKEEKISLIEKQLLPQLAAVLIEFEEKHGAINGAQVILNLGARDGYPGYSIFREMDGNRSGFCRSQLLTLQREWERQQAEQEKAPQDSENEISEDDETEADH